MKKSNVLDISSFNDAVMVVLDMMMDLMDDWTNAGFEGDFDLDDVKTVAKEILVDSNYGDLSKMQILWIMRV